MAYYHSRSNNLRGKNITIDKIDYKNVGLIQQFLNATKIVPARNTGVSAKIQRKVSKAIKHARFLALLPYTDQQQ